MHHFLRLIRTPNLVILALTILLMRYAVIEPVVIVYGLSLVFPVWQFVLLIVAVVCIAAAGYVINDYYDVQTDSVNKPNKVIIGKHISAKSAYSSYFVFNGIAILLIAVITFLNKFLAYFELSLAVIGLLWFYSTKFKRQLIIGNIIISLFTALASFLSAMFDVPLINRTYKEFLLNNHINMNVVVAWAGAFAAFAFLTNLLREIVKDAEDFEGDQSTGCNTLPIVFGIRITKVVVSVISLLIVALLYCLFFVFLRNDFSGEFDYFTFAYFTLLIALPLCAVAVLTIAATSKRNFTRASLIIKLVMVTGILFSLVLRYRLLHSI